MTDNEVSVLFYVSIFSSIEFMMKKKTVSSIIRETNLLTGGPWEPGDPFSPGGPASPLGPELPGVPGAPLLPGGPGGPSLPGAPLTPGGPGLPYKMCLKFEYFIIKIVNISCLFYLHSKNFI